MTHRFVILIDGQLKTYSDYNSIPPSFENVIEFVPHIPQGPHTDSQHDEIDLWNHRLKDLLKRETK